MEKQDKREPRIVQELRDLPRAIAKAADEARLAAEFIEPMESLTRFLITLAVAVLVVSGTMAGTRAGGGIMRHGWLVASWALLLGSSIAGILNILFFISVRYRLSGIARSTAALAHDLPSPSKVELEPEAAQKLEELPPAVTQVITNVAEVAKSVQALSTQTPQRVKRGVHSQLWMLAVGILLFFTWAILEVVRG